MLEMNEDCELWSVLQDAAESGIGVIGRLQKHASSAFYPAI